ncbi:diphthine--ammonia ligase [Schistocerca piceifrons]|uniref:diphthine--ammonia ligase n=1 Tax=Schistocerca piceifrons TaxID=274613 RepID=UPI001F5F54DE|nr:diphthine--ammonia ligase [Schistocerca piceifrons]
MKVVALISGGKDSCYNMLQCVAAGHEVVALANLYPENKEELDSYMYQCVGHQGVELFAEAVGLPLFRRAISGVAINCGPQYTPTPSDEVEDLHELLALVKEEMNVEAVAVGAILSDYQRIRVENVCSRLGLVALAYLWRRDQEELLQEMIDCAVEAVVIKVAALGLHPSVHLGLTLTDLQPNFLRMKEKYGLNVCGEGGEYESFTLDCPLFTKTIVIDEAETIIHSDDAIAPVGYLVFKKLHLVEKENAHFTMAERIAGLPVKTWQDLTADIDEEAEDSPPTPPKGRDADTGYGPDDDYNDDCEFTETQEKIPLDDSDADSSYSEGIDESTQTYLPLSATDEAGWTWVAGVEGHGKNTSAAMRDALDQLQSLVPLSDVVSVTLYVRDMSQYPAANREYAVAFPGPDPPARVCVQCPLPEGVPVSLEATAHRAGGPGEDGCVDPGAGDGKCWLGRRQLHVQGVSHWAPANIGPYSQAVRVGDIMYMAGQIGLVPGTMQLIEGGIKRQCRLALRHIERVARAVDSTTQLRDVVQAICYVTRGTHIWEARLEWERHTTNAIADYVVVPRLPRGALVEWSVWLHRHNNRFEYEETGCLIGPFQVSICRRWNYENKVSAIVSRISIVLESVNLYAGASYLSGSRESEDCPDSLPPSPRPMTRDELDEAMSYTLSRLLRDSPAAAPVCHLRLAYCSSSEHAPQPPELRAAAARAAEANGTTVVASLLPVRGLMTKWTFLSVCGVRHH